MGEELARTKKVKKNRIWEIDFLRGISIFLMILDHLLWDVMFLPNVFSNYHEVKNPFIDGFRNFASLIWASPSRYWAHLIFAASFFVLSGISCALSKNNFFHALKILIAGAVLDLATYIIFWISGDSSVPMIFNVLIALGFGVLLVALLNLIPMPKTFRGFLYIGLGVAIFIVCCIFDLYWKFDRGSWTGQFEPSRFFEYLVGSLSWGSDCFPPIPYSAFTIFGAGLGILLYQDKRKSLLPKLDGFWNKPVCFLGRNTLWVYLGHQVVIWLILGLLCLALGYRIAL